MCFPQHSRCWQWGANCFCPSCHGHWGVNLEGFGVSPPFSWCFAGTLLGSALKKGTDCFHFMVDSETSPHPHNPMRKHGLPPQKGTVWEFHSCFSIILHPACLEDISLCSSTIKDSGAKAAFCTPALLL